MTLVDLKAAHAFIEDISAVYPQPEALGAGLSTAIRFGEAGVAAEARGA